MERRSKKGLIICSYKAFNSILLSLFCFILFDAHNICKERTQFVTERLLKFDFR